MRRPRVLVVYKKSAYQLYAVEKREPKVRALLRRNASSVRQLEQSHRAHERAREVVIRACIEAGAHVKEVYRAHLRPTRNVDLVVTVGGDGTMLDASHRLLDVPLLGVNSNPNRSVGHLTGANAQTFPTVLASVLAGALKPLNIMRLEVFLNGRSLKVPILNDVLFCHANPAATSRYHFQVGRRAEEQKSSGVWVSTPTGSTAAMRGAGGRAQAMTERRFQWRVREPWAPPGKQVALVGGLVGTSGRVTWTSMMRDGAVFLDGSHIRHTVGMGDVVEVAAHPVALQLVRPPR